MKFYDASKNIARKLVLGTSMAMVGLTGLAGVVSAQEKPAASEQKFKPVEVNTLQKNIGETEIEVSIWQMAEKDSNAQYPTKINVYFSKRVDNMLPAKTPISDTFHSTSDRCWGMSISDRNDDGFDDVRLYERGCGEPMAKRVFKATYLNDKQNNFIKQK